MGQRNEEFAEVFAANTLNPKVLFNNDSACRRAFEFMKKFVYSEKVDPLCPALSKS